MTAVVTEKVWRLRPSTEDVVATDYGRNASVTLHRRDCSYVREYADVLPTAILPSLADRLVKAMEDHGKVSLCHRCLIEYPR